MADRSDNKKKQYLLRFPNDMKLWKPMIANDLNKHGAQNKPTARHVILYNAFLNISNIVSFAVRNKSKAFFSGIQMRRSNMAVHLLWNEDTKCKQYKF